jgi:uncharacterized protein
LLSHTAGANQVFSAKVRSQLKSYVYAYIDPRTGRSFYIGQGKNNRAFDHLTEHKDSDKVRIINELRALGLSPEISILRHGLTEEEAKLVESVCIDFAGLDMLSNGVKGKYSKKFGRSGIQEMIRRYDAPPTKPTEKCIAINVNQSYKPGMTDRQIYECTRGIWPLGKEKDKAEYALAVYQDVIVEVFKIEGWHKAGDIFSERTHLANNRHEFVGNVSTQLSAKYKGKSLLGMFSGGKRFPVRYLNIKNKA